MDFADVKPSIPNLVLIGLMSCIFIVFLKFAMAKWPVPGLSEFAAAI